MKTFEQQQQELVENFKKSLSKCADEAISKFYCDVTPFAEHDATINFTNKLRDEIHDELVKEIATKYTHYSWASSIRMALLKNYKTELQNKIIEDLQGQIERLTLELNQCYQRRY